MGKYLIPGTGYGDLAAIIRHAGPDTDIVWDHGSEGGVLATSETLSDASLAALYSGFDPAQYPADELPDAVRDAGRIAHRLAYATDAELAAVTAAEQRAALRALARCVLYLNARLDVSD